MIDRRATPQVRHYLKGWFPIDAIGAIPWEVINRIANSSDGSGAMVSLVRVLKMPKLLRVARLLKTLEHFGALSNIVQARARAPHISTARARAENAAYSPRAPVPRERCVWPPTRPTRPRLRGHTPAHAHTRPCTRTQYASHVPVHVPFATHVQRARVHASLGRL